MWQRRLLVSFLCVEGEWEVLERRKDRIVGEKDLNLKIKSSAGTPLTPSVRRERDTGTLYLSGGYAMSVLA